MEHNQNLTVTYESKKTSTPPNRTLDSRGLPRYGNKNYIYNIMSNSYTQTHLENLGLSDAYSMNDIPLYDELY